MALPSLSTVRIAWRNLGRNRWRTGLAVGAIALGQVTLVFVNCLMAGSFHSMFRTITGPLVGHVQIQHPHWREERATDLYVEDAAALMADLEALPDVVAVSPRRYAPALAARINPEGGPADAEPAMIVGLETGAEAGAAGLLNALPPDQLPGHGRVALGRVLANRLGASAGDEVALIGQDADGFPNSDLFTVSGVIDGTVDMVKTRGVVMAAEDAARFLAMPDEVHQVIVYGGDHEKAQELAAAVSALDSVADAEVQTWREAVPELVRLLGMKSKIDLIFLLILFVAAAAGVANTAMMSTFERTHEFGMLLAIGSRPGRVVGMVIIESVILGLVGVAVGSVIGGLAVWITSHTGIDYGALAGSDVQDFSYRGLSFSYVVYPRFEFRHVVFGVCAVTLTSVLASLWPAVLAARMEPVEAMRT